MAARSNLVVIDASIVLAWILPDERFMESANELFAKSVGGETSFTSPALLFYEVINAIRSAFLRKRLSKNQVARAIKQFTNIDIRLENQSKSEKEIVNMAIELELSVYDASYIYLAKTLAADFYTTDQILAKKTSSVIKVHPLAG